MCLAAIYWARLDRVFFANTRRDAAAIGFDDEVIYQQVGLGIDERSLPMTQMMRPEAMPVFEEWRAKPDKTAY
jgi:tRNA(Arg) A34 adenosine deaminase TadA